MVEVAVDELLELGKVPIVNHEPGSVKLLGLENNLNGVGVPVESSTLVTFWQLVQAMTGVEREPLTDRVHDLQYNLRSSACHYSLQDGPSGW